MKKFKDTSVTGEAGEYYFAYWIVRNFKWPCRLIDIDVGVDAQVEVFEDEISTGDFFAVQVKTTDKDSPDIQITLSDFKYWLQIENNVVLASIVLGSTFSEPTIYWKHMPHDFLVETIRVLESLDQKTKLISFTNENILDITSKRKWLDSLIDEETKELMSDAKTLIESLAYYSKPIGDESYFEGDYVSLKLYIEKINKIFADYERIESIFSFDKRLGIKAPVITTAINDFKSKEAVLIDCFTRYFDDLKDDNSPAEILPDNLSVRANKITSRWVGGYLGYK